MSREQHHKGGKFQISNTCSKPSCLQPPISLGWQPWANRDRPWYWSCLLRQRWLWMHVLLRRGSEGSSSCEGEGKDDELHDVIGVDLSKLWIGKCVVRNLWFLGGVKNDEWVKQRHPRSPFQTRILNRSKNIGRRLYARTSGFFNFHYSKAFIRIYYLFIFVSKNDEGFQPIRKIPLRIRKFKFTKTRLNRNPVFSFLLSGSFVLVDWCLQNIR